MTTRKKGSSGHSPETQALGKLQAKRLSLVTGIDENKLSGLSIKEISDKFQFELDLTHLFYRKVCGQVVKTDPATGIQYPVPYATVHVEDTDCNLLAYAPVDSPYLWYFPFFCHREEIASVVTDACGHFCVNIPRWDIDWILKWRKERICFPNIFIKPNIRDILDDLFPRIPDVFPPRPQPDPAPWFNKEIGPNLARARAVLGDTVVEQFEQFYEGAVFGSPATQIQKLLGSPAFGKSLPPPLPMDITNHASTCGGFNKYGLVNKEALHTLSSTITATPELSAHLQDFQLNRYIGPFRRCFDILIPQWSMIFDVPDITFRVTQDVDGDGDEETIYSESLFDVRWDAGDIPDITLEASEIALSVHSCGAPSGLPCEEPAIVTAGLMPLHNPGSDPIPYHDQATGYARRPNRPHPSGSFAIPALPSPPPAELLATAPFTGSVQLYGCNEHTGAKYYRLRYKYNGSAVQTFNGHSWKVVRWVGSPGHLETKVITPDANGWYEILPVTDEWLPSHLLLSWPTTAYQNGLYDVHMELANNGKSVIHTTAEIGLRIDNTWNGNNTAGSVAQFTVLRWRHVGELTWHSLLVACPVVRRDAGKDIEIEVGIEVAAPHLRSIVLWASGCGGTHPALSGSSIPADWENYLLTRGMRHWHTSAFDNSFNNSLSPARYTIPASAQSGVYGFHLRAHTRAFNPAGGDGGFDVDWHYNPVYNWRYPDMQIAVVDA